MKTYNDFYNYAIQQGHSPEEAHDYAELNTKDIEEDFDMPENNFDIEDEVFVDPLDASDAE